MAVILIKGKLINLAKVNAASVGIAQGRANKDRSYIYELRIWFTGDEIPHTFDYKSEEDANKVLRRIEKAMTPE